MLFYIRSLSFVVNKCDAQIVQAVNYNVFIQNLASNPIPIACMIQCENILRVHLNIEICAICECTASERNIMHVAVIVHEGRCQFLTV